MLQLESGTVICAVPTEDTGRAWPLVLPFVQLALEQGLGECDAPDVLKALMSGNAQLWLAVEGDDRVQGIAVTEVISHPQRKICNLFLVAGTGLDQWASGLRYIESWAIAKGCNGLQATCRPGAAKKAERLGFKVMRQQVFKPLLENQQ